ncbi:integrase arm-type DNA-binding domain-containing protein [Duganella sp. FT109W]|uniref:Integrase arm-type DNA-binding domain-containing protein n=1 Tax=Duganella margarita TaxID=2692170 RepID=A0ABW9WC61_9BURK|nr:integrase arm-type DNA-binding domain-containing protein [Duganella margarita]MYN38637.1 integrase arm-type DNA-binding domain-containing protein [Duganella margarita]
MPKIIAPLTEMQVRKAKPHEKAYRLFDGGGLYLEVTPKGSRIWRMKFRQANGSENVLTFGPYPEITLQNAREKRLEARRLILQGDDPAKLRDATKRRAAEEAANTFEKIAREWYANKVPTWSERTSKNMIQRLEADIFPQIGKLPIAELKHRDVIAALRKIEQRGAAEIAHRMKAVCAQIFSYAIQCGLTDRNLVVDMKDVLKTRRASHFAAIDADELPAFLGVLERNEARMFQPTRIALRLMLLVFVRTSELIETPWSEINLEKGEWIIPWQRMKRGKLTVNPDMTDHHVCLSRQACHLLRELHAITGSGTYLFPNQRDHHKPISNNTLLVALERMGYKGRMTGHGFRALAMSTIKERLGYRHEVVDRQLAHAPKDKVASAYDRAQFLAERHRMMQDWADYIDSVAADVLQK